MKCESTALCLVLFCLGCSKNEAALDDHLDIWCLDDSQRNEKDLMQLVGHDLQRCNFTETDDYPFSFGDVKTPAAPESISTQVEIYNTSDATSTIQIAVLISWQYKKEYFSAVEQYHIEMIDVTRGMHGGAKQFIFTWDDDLIQAIHNSTAQFLQFHFFYTGRYGEGKYFVKPEDELFLRLQGLPMYAEDAEPQDVYTRMKIPGCDEKEIRKSQKCDEARKCKPEEIYWNKICFIPTQRMPAKKKRPKGVTAATYPRKKFSRDPLLVLAATIGSVAFVVLIGIYIWCRRRKFVAYRESPHHKDERSRVLLVCTKDIGFIDAINQLIELILKIPNVDVVCNLRQRTDIGMHGIQEWTKKEVSNSSMICFVVANRFEISKVDAEENEQSRLDDVEKHQLPIVISAIEAMVISKALENSPKKFVVLDLCSCVKRETLPYFTHYKLPGDFKKFFKCIPGKVAKSQKKRMEKEKKVFLNLLSNAQLGYSHTISGCDESNEVVMKNNHRLSQLQSNDLDEDDIKDECFDENELRSANDFSMNIPTNAPSSYDFPRSDDFNHCNEIELPRYIQTGAKPKETNR